MYPNLYYAVKDLFGIEIGFLKIIQSFGFFVALSFLMGSYFFSLELKRKENEGLLKPVEVPVLSKKTISFFDFALSLLLGFLIGYKLIYIIFNFDAFKENTQQGILSLKGNLIGGLLLGAIALLLKIRETRQLARTHFVPSTLIVHPYDHIGAMTTIAAISGLIGAKIFHNLENWDLFLKDPMDALLSFSGLTMYGGLIFGAVSVIWYAHKNNINVRHLIDASAPGLMLAYGVGRIGCQVAGDGDWGIDNTAPKPSWMSFLPDWCWAYSYPHNVLNEHLNAPVFPTPLYEALISIALFFFLWSIRRKIKTPAVLFCIYLLLNGIERFFIEKIRINTQYHIFGHGITQAEIISFLLVLTGLIGIAWFKKKPALA